jgi:thioredoxin reductase
MIVVDELNSVPLFSGVERDHLAPLAQTAGDVQLGVGEYAAHEGDPPALFVVLSGKIEVTKLFDGIERIIGARAPGQIFGEVPSDANGYVLTGDAVARAGRWRQDRDPYLLETSVPGIFACGDVRSSPVKRVAAAVGEGSMAVAFIQRYLAPSYAVTG